MKTKIERRIKIKKRIASKVKGTAERPRLVVFRSNKEIYAQLIDDNQAVTFASASSRQLDASGKGAKCDVSFAVGKLIAQKAKEKGIETVVFDRNGYVYHGRVKNLADGARDGGLKF